MGSLEGVAIAIGLRIIQGIKRCATVSFGCRESICFIRLARSRFWSWIPSLVSWLNTLRYITPYLMNKADLVNLVAARTELTKTDVSLVIDAAIDTIIDSVVEGKKVSILGFGSFEPRAR